MKGIRQPNKYIQTYAYICKTVKSFSNNSKKKYNQQIAAHFDRRPIYSYHRRLKCAWIEHLEFLIAYFAYKIDALGILFFFTLCCAEFFTFRDQLNPKVAEKRARNSNGNAIDCLVLKMPREKKRFTEMKSCMKFFFGNYWTTWKITCYSSRWCILCLDYWLSLFAIDCR